MESLTISFIICKADVGECEQQWGSYFHTAESDLLSQPWAVPGPSRPPCTGAAPAPRPAQRSRAETQLPVLEKSYMCSWSFPMPANRLPTCLMRKQGRAERCGCSGENTSSWRPECSQNIPTYRY